MNYTLEISIEGAEAANSALDSILKKVGGIYRASNKPISWFSRGEGQKAGEDIGASISQGITSRLSRFNILDAWGKSKLKGINDFWKDAVSVGQAQTGTIKGLKEPGGKELAKVLNLPDINSYNKPPPISTVDRKALLLGAMTTLFNPFVGARMLSDAMPKNSTTGGNGIAKGFFGASGAIGYGEIFLAVKGIELVLKMFKAAVTAVVSEIGSAIKYAHSLYASALTQGLGLKFLAGRQMTASVLGVPEDQVFRMQQTAYVMQRLSNAISSISKDAPALANISVQWKILSYDLLAAASDLAVKLEPAIVGLATAIDMAIKPIEKLTAIAFLLASVGNFGNVSKLGADIAVELNKALSGFAGKNLGALGQPGSFMKQLPASSWEKMGLVTMGSNQNYAKDTANNTKQIVTILRRIRQGDSTSTSFGLDPKTANP